MIKPRSKRNDSTSAKYLSETQLKKLLQYVSNKADFARQTGATRAIVDELIIFLLVNAGLRPAEFCNLNIEDLPTSHGKSVLLIRDSADTATREVEISSKTAERIERFVMLYRKKTKPKEPLFVSERGNRLTYRSLYNKVKNIGVNIGIGPLYPHMLRSTYIVRLFNTVHDLRLVQQQAGHASPKTTAMYVRNDFRRKQKGERLGNADSTYPKVTPDFSQAKDNSIRCGACDRLLRGEGKKIDSGQILCHDCSKYFQ